MSYNKKSSSAPPDPEKVAEALSNNMLREMINELEETKLSLLLNIKELKEKLSQQKDDQADIYFYLNKKCDEGFEVIASLEEQIINEQTDREIAEKLYENKIEELKSAHQVMEAKHMSKISELETRLEMLNSFSEEKEESERNLKVLMNKLEEERNQFRINTESIENRFLVERDKLRKTYDQKYEQIKKELEDSVENKMSNKTKKTQLMNVIMKKELDSQSQHAEKLLEINQAMLERDKALKLELDVATSLNKDMTLRLAMTQRTVKQLHEKLSAMEATEAANRRQHEAALHEKVEALIQLEAKLKNVNKKTSSENSKLDEMWHFLAQSFQMLKTAKKKRGQQQQAPAKDSLEEHEQLLVGLIKEVLRRYPQLLQEIGPLGAGKDFPPQQQHHHQSSSHHAVRESSAASPPPTSSVSVSVTTSWVMQSQSSLSATGIPAWDTKTFDNGTLANPNQRSIAVQTEGKVAPYPDGSLWMEAPGARSLYFQQQSAALAAAAAASLDGDNSSIGFNSVQSLWRSADGALGGGGGGVGMGMTSLTSNDDNYSAKTASHVLQAPPHGKTKSSKIISKMRRKNMRNVGSNANSGADFDDLPRHINLHQSHQHQLASSMTIEGETLYAGGNSRSKAYYGTAGASTNSNSGHLMPRTPVSLDLTSPSPVFPSPLSLGSSAQLLLAASSNGQGHGVRPSPWLSNALLGGTAGSFVGSSGLHAKHQQPFSPIMSISGQGFVAPLVLPKLS